jgi:hypothetical protein
MRSLLLALALAGGSAEDASPPPREQISPVTVTAKKVHEPDFGEIHELRRRQVQKQIQEKRSIERRDLAENRALWAEKQIANYRFTLSGHGSWGTCLGPIVVTVQGGSVSSTEYARAPLPPGVVECNWPQGEVANAEPYDTVSNLFSIVDDLLKNPSMLLSIQYDTQYGYPASISTDEWGVSDSSFTIYIGGFEVLQ